LTRVGKSFNLNFSGKEGEMTYTPVVHGGQYHDFALEPQKAQFLFLPSTGDRQFAFVVVEVKVKRQGKEGKGSGFDVMIQVPLPAKDETHYYIAYERLPAEGKLEEKIGLIPGGKDGPPPQGEVFWRRDFREPDEWHPGIIVEYGSGNIGLGAYPLMRVGSRFKEHGELHFIEWALTFGRGKFYGTNPDGCLAAVDIKGLEGISLTLAALARVQAVVRQCHTDEQKATD
jgi:hypothetical protein